MTEVKTYPDIYNNIISPSDEIPLLDFYKGYYDCIYIILHPFLKVTHPDNIDFERIWPAKQSWPTKAEILKFTEKVSWSDILLQSDIKDINQLDIALRSSILGLSERPENKQDAKYIVDFTNENNLIRPTEGLFNEVLMNDMLKALISLGHDWIFTGDEFGHERKLQYIQDIIDSNDVEDYRKNWYTTKNEVLYTTHWDSHYTMLCSDRKTVEKILEKYPFEGFYCNPDTEIFWSIHTPITN